MPIKCFSKTSHWMSSVRFPTFPTAKMSPFPSNSGKAAFLDWAFFQLHGHGSLPHLWSTMTSSPSSRLALTQPGCSRLGQLLLSSPRLQTKLYIQLPFTVLHTEFCSRFTAISSMMYSKGWCTLLRHIAVQWRIFIPILSSGSLSAMLQITLPPLLSPISQPSL